MVLCPTSNFFQIQVELLLITHWWGGFQGVSCDTPIDVADSECLRAALEEISIKEDDIFISHHQSPSWLSGVPDVVKDFFAVTLMCVDDSIIEQAHEFLLPAFSLFPNKDYCVVTQPHTSPMTPFLSHFSIVPAKPTNSFSHCLFVIHRALVCGMLPTVRSYMPGVDTAAVTALSYDVQDVEDAIFVRSAATREVSTYFRLPCLSGH